MRGGMYNSTTAWTDRGRHRSGCNNPVVSYNRRQPRQGVRYGPPRQRDRYSENGVIIGRLLGLAILLLTLGVLAAGALAFIGDRRPAGSTSRATTSAAVTVSPGRSASATPASVVASISALPTAAVVPATALLSPPSSSQPPQVQIGPGFVTFGTRADRQLRVQDPSASFGIGDRIVWSAHLTERANSVDLRIHVFKVDGTPPTGERLVLDEAVTPLVRGAQIFERRIQPSEVLDGPGLYIVRYVRGTDILSQGALEITT
jgi:hypothetical protein